MSENSERGTGRTTRIIESMPDTGGVLIIYESRERWHTEDLLRKCGKEANILTVHDVAHRRLDGCRQPIYVDHRVWEEAPGEISDYIFQIKCRNLPEPKFQ